MFYHHHNPRYISAAWAIMVLRRKPSTLFLQRRLPCCLCTCAGRRLARSSCLLKCLLSGPNDKKGKIASRAAARRQAQANRQTSADLALLSRKLDYTTADPPKLRPGVRGVVSARLREQGRNGPAASHCPFVHGHPQSLRSLALLFLTRPYVFRRTHSFLAVSLQTSRSLQHSHSLR